MMDLYDALKTVFSSSHFLWSSDKSLNLKSARITPVTHLIDALCEMSSLLWKRRCMQQVWGMCVCCVFKEDWTYSRNCWCWQDGFSTATQLQQPRTCGAALLKARSIYCKRVGGRGCACCNFIKSKQKNKKTLSSSCGNHISGLQPGRQGRAGRQHLSVQYLVKQFLIRSICHRNSASNRTHPHLFFSLHIFPHFLTVQF